MVKVVYEDTKKKKKTTTHPVVKPVHSSLGSESKKHNMYISISYISQTLWQNNQ